MSYLGNLSIRRKLLFIILAVSVFASVSGLIIEYYFESERIINSKTKNTLFDARLIASYCVMPMAFDNPEAAHEVLQKLEDAPQMFCGVLFTNNDSIFASYTKTKSEFTSIPVELDDQISFAQQNFIHVKQPVEYKGEVYGYLYLKAYSDIQQINRVRLTRLIILVFALAVIAYILSIYLQSYISLPILKLSEHTQAVAKSKDYSLRIKKHYNDETGLLYNHFNQMLETIEKADNELDDYRMKLEELVDKRTYDLKQTNKELIIAKEQAEKANHAKSDFLSSMSHELRTPLNGILGYAQILKTMGKLNNSQAEQIDIIHSSGKHLLGIINEILDFSKIEANKLELQVTNFAFHDLIKHVINIVRIRAEQKDLVLEYDKQSEIPEFVTGDETKIRQILINLLNNAVKYTIAGKVILRIKFDETKKRNLVVEVEDTGIGIPNDKIEDIFEPFTQIDEKANFIEGTGLGLTITNKLIELMDGYLTVTSTLNKGSVFKIEINLPIVNQAPEKENLVHDIIGYKGPKILILAVDDNLTNLSVLISALEPLGFEVITAQNGEQAIEQVKLYGPKLVLMDFVMPKMNGTETIMEIRKLPKTKDIKVIGITASVIQRGDIIDFISACDAHVIKPIEVQELQKSIKDLMGIEWIHENDEQSNEQPDINIQHIKERTPENRILNEIIEYAEIGDFSSIENSLQLLVQKDKNYYWFEKKVKTFIEKYDSDRLVNYITFEVM